MTEPHIIPEEVRHVVRLKCTSKDLLVLAELARDHKTQEAHVPFWKIRLR